MSRRVSDETLALIHERVSFIRKREDAALFYEVFDGNKPIGHAKLCSATDLSALLDELRKRRDNTGSRGRIGQVAALLMGMKVGDTEILAPTTPGNLSSARKTARRRLGVAGVWHAHTESTGWITVTRQPDGSPRHAHYSNPAVQALAATRVGETIILTTLRSKMHNGIKVRARAVMNNPYANWRCENRANGNVRATRIR